MTSPAANLAGSVTLASTAADTAAAAWPRSSTSTASAAGRLDERLLVAHDAVLVRVQHRLGRRRPLRLPAIVTDNVGRTTTSAAVTNRRIDNTNPVTATLAAVGTNLAGNVNFTGTAADNTGGSGVASWKVQSSPTGTDTWTDLCTDAATPFGACTGNVDGLADGVYDFRALVTDNAGNTLGSTVQTSRRVDTDGPVTSVASPDERHPRERQRHDDRQRERPGRRHRRRLPGLLPRRLVHVLHRQHAAATPATGDSTQVADGTYQTRVVATDSLGHHDHVGDDHADHRQHAPDRRPTCRRPTAAPPAASTPATRSPSPGPSRWRPPRSSPAGTARAHGDPRARQRRRQQRHASTSTTRPARRKLNVTRRHRRCALNANYVDGDRRLQRRRWRCRATASWSRSALSSVSGTHQHRRDDAAHLQLELVDRRATDVAGNAATGNTVNESGGNDRDF